MMPHLRTPLPLPLCLAQVASRIVSAFTTFKNYDPARQVGAGRGGQRCT